jgi:3-oxoacyl-[acyl-carrier protein] reductase
LTQGEDQVSEGRIQPPEGGNMGVSLRGKTAVVTGASKGIGYEIAAAMAAAEANLVVCARNAEEIAAAAREISGLGSGEVIGVTCDVRVQDDVRRLIGRAVEEFDRIDILVNNAGVGGFGPVDELSPDTWHQVIETNLNGVYYACHEAIPHMKRQGNGAWIINIGSLAGKNPFAGGAAYNASKFGLLGFSEAMMLDVRQHNIRVTCIMPGSVETHFSGTGSHAGGGAGDWKLQSEDIARMVMDLLAFPPRALPSRIEMRPTKPPKR